MRQINGDACNDRLLKLNKPCLSFDESKDFESQKQSIKQAFRRLLRMDKIEGNAAPENKPEIESVVDKGEYIQIRFTFESEIESFVPCYLLLPKNREKCPLAITLQGHSTGAHNSIGEPLFDGDEEYIKTRGDFGVQAVHQGYAALVIEQRGMGARKPQRKNRQGYCRFASSRALLLGKTILGERIFDISKAIDAVQDLGEYSLPIDNTKIVCTGNSGGGTATYYAACYDERITLAVPSCGTCTYAASIADILHCECNYIPHALEYFEMADLSILIAPRKLSIINGGLDDIFPAYGAREFYETAQRIYAKAGVKENVNLVITPQAHYWCKDIVWGEIMEKINERKTETHNER